MQSKWRSTLTLLGIDPRSLTGKHAACPLCGGKDRFRFDDKDAKGTWICSKCGAGTGFKLIMKLKGIEYGDALKMVKSTSGNAVAAEVKPPLTVERQKDLLRQLWRQSSPVESGDITDRYLTSRGIGIRSAALRTTPEMMLALVSDGSGKPATLHRTYLPGKNRKLMPGALPDNVAIRLMPFTDTLGIAEGIETALSAAQLFQVPVWSSICAGMMEKWHPPQGVKKVVIFGDNDESFTGQKAAYSLAFRLKTAGLQVDVKIPAVTGDWNDVLRKHSAAA